MKKIALVAVIIFGALSLLSAEAVKASSFGFDSENATECLQKAIRSGARTVEIDKVDGDWIIGPVELASDQEIIIGKNVTVRALKGSFKDKKDAMFFSENGKNIIVRGSGNSRLIMNKMDYQNRKLYDSSEWRHIFSFLSCENVTVKDLKLSSSGGDGVYLGVGGNRERLYCDNVLLENLAVTDQHRQGISVISARSLTIRNCSFDNTSGTPPQAGIDFEPNRSGQELTNILIEKCGFSGNSGSGIEFLLNHLSEKSEPVSITIKDCRIADNRNNLMLMQGRNPNIRGRVEFLNCTFTAGKGKGNVRVDGLGKDFSVLFRDCTINTDDSAVGNGAFNISSSLPDVGHIVLENLKVNGPAAPVSVKATAGSAPALGNLSGTILHNGQSYDLPGFIAAYEAHRRQLAALKDATVDVNTLAPAPGTGRVSVSGRFPLRGTGSFLQYCEAGDKFELEVRPFPLGRARKKQLLLVTDPQGKIIRKLEPDSDGKAHRIEFTAEQTGVYRVQYDTRRAMLFIKSAMPGQGLSSNGELCMVRPSGRLYFEVPAGVREFSLVLSGDPGELLSAVLRGPDGKAVFSGRDFDEKTIFTGTRSDASAPEIWSIDFIRAEEDVALRFCEPLAPVGAGSPEALLRRK